MAVKLEVIKSRLLGNPGIHKDAEKYAPPVRRDTPITTGRIFAALAFIRSLAGFHPHTGVRETMRDRLDRLSKKMPVERGQDDG